MEIEEFKKLLARQRQFFNTGTTLPIAFRLTKLSELYAAFRKHEQSIFDALYTDLHKSKIEAYEGEIYPSIAEISYAKKHLRSWAAVRRTRGPKLFPFSRGYVMQVPRGVSLIISPYNHPFSTTFTPLVSAIAAGNCVIVKPSELVPNASRVIATLIKCVFDESHVAVIEGGGKEVAEALLQLEVDNIFFTGSTSVGRSVMETAAKRLIPVTLELSGKCPGIVTETAAVENAAARIAWGKFWNAGQSCNTIDHVFVHKKIKNAFLYYLKKYLIEYYTTDAQKSLNYGRIVNVRHFDRISQYLSQGDIVYGGHSDKNDLYIEPTLLEHITEGAALLDEEIFGPLLPIFEYENINEVIPKINAKAPALAIYIFSKDRTLANRLLKETRSGTACVNDLMIQSLSAAMPVGGVGASGFGRMHGKEGFEAFSYSRSVLYQPTFDLPFRFPPYNKRFLLPLIERFLR